MQKRIKQFGALLLIPVLLWAGAGFSLSRHYCLGMLVEENFYYEAEACESKIEQSEDDCLVSNQHTGFSIEHDDCCDDEWLNVPQVEVKNISEDKNKELPLPIELEPQQPIELLVQATSPEVILKENIDPRINTSHKPGLSQYLAEIQSYLI